MKSAMAWSGPLARLIAGPLERLVPATALTVTTVPSAGATIVARAIWSLRSMTWPSACV